MTHFLKLLAVLAGTPILVAACAGLDRRVDGFLMDRGVLVQSNTNYSNSVTRDYQKFRGDRYEEKSCTDFVSYHKSTSRYFDYRGNMRYPSSESSTRSHHCVGERTYPRLSTPKPLPPGKKEHRSNLPWYQQLLPSPPPSAYDRQRFPPPRSNGEKVDEEVKL